MLFLPCSLHNVNTGYCLQSSQDNMASPVHLPSGWSHCHYRSNIFQQWSHSFLDGLLYTWGLHSCEVSDWAQRVHLTHGGLRLWDAASTTPTLPGPFAHAYLCVSECVFSPKFCTSPFYFNQMLPAKATVNATCISLVTPLSNYVLQNSTWKSKER